MLSLVWVTYKQGKRKVKKSVLSCQSNEEDSVTPVEAEKKQRYE